jgi:hypothetical protein
MFYNMGNVFLRNTRMNDTPIISVKYELICAYPKEASGDYSSFLIKISM